MRLDIERVYFALHHFSQRGIYHTVARHRILSGKLRRDDAQHIMPAAIARAGMSGVLVAFVDDIERNRGERGEALAHYIHARTHAGNTFLNGCTVVCAYTPVATYGSDAAHSRAACNEANSATIRLPE